MGNLGGRAGPDSQRRRTGDVHESFSGWSQQRGVHWIYLMAATFAILHPARFSASQICDVTTKKYRRATLNR
jgi:hypothetical protein